MACQFMEWLIASAEPTAMQHTLIGAGILLTFGVVRRLRARGVAERHTEHSPEELSARRRAA